MTEQDGDKYIKCSQCKCKYNNDEDSITAYFGYNRLNEQLKTCVKCRNCRTQRRQELMRIADESNCAVYYCYRCYKNKPPNDFTCPNGKAYNACYPCLKKRYG